MLDETTLQVTTVACLHCCIHQALATSTTLAYKLPSIDDPGHTNHVTILANSNPNSHTHTHPFNGPFSGTTRVGRYQKGKTNLDFTEARDRVAVASAGPYASLHLASDR